jgi:hypothetical protein
MATPASCLRNRRHTTDGQGILPRAVLFSGIDTPVVTAVDEFIVDETDEDLYIEGEDEEDTAKLEDDMLGFGMSLGDLQECRLACSPSLASWKDVTLDEAPVRATIGEPTEIVWRDAKAEIEFIRETVFKTKFKTRRPSFSEVSSLLFGKSSKLRLVFMYKLGWTSELFDKFIRTFIVQSAHRLSTTQLYNKHGYIVKGETKKTLLEPGEYIKMWNSIGEACLIPNQRASGHVTGETFWAAVESALNEELRNTILPSFLASDLVSSFRVIFDDDKMHFALGKNQSSASLQMVQHVRENRRGPVCHQAVLSASGLLVGCTFERNKDTSTSCTNRIVHSQMIPMQGGATTGPGTLQKLIVGGDRAYQNRELLYESFIPSGAKVLGTKMRTKDFPLVYGARLDQAKEKREVVSLNGPKTVIVKKVRTKKVWH